MKLFEKFRFWSNFRKISILVKISKIFGFFENYRKISILDEFSKITFLDKLSKQISISVKIFEDFHNADFSQNFFEIFRFWFEICEKFRFWSKFRFCWNFGKNFDFGQNCRINYVFVYISEKISIMVKLLQKVGQIFDFWSKFSKNSGFGHIFEKNFVKLSKKISILVKIFENFKNVDFSNIFVKFRFWSNFFENFDFFENFEKFRFC